MSNWLTDPTANKYIQSYFKNYVEISGNFIVHDSQYVDISNNITLKNGAYLKFPDGSIFTSANLPVTSIPTDISFSNMDISQNFSVNGTTTLKGNLTMNGNINMNGNITNIGNLSFSNGTTQNTAYTPDTTISVNNFTATGTLTLPANSISNSALQTDVVTTTASQTLTNKIINSVGITDTATANFNNVSISGTLTLPTSVNMTNLSVTNLTSTNGNITEISATNETISGRLKVTGTTSLGVIQILDTSIRILPVTGILLGAPINSTQFAYPVSLLGPSVGDYLSGNPIAGGMTNYGTSGPNISAIDIPNQIVTFSSSFGAVPTAVSNKQVYGYASSATTIQTYTYKSVAVNDICVPTASAVKPYINSLSTPNKTITLAGACLTPVTGTTTSGVYDATNKLISNAMPPLGTLFGSLSMTSTIDTLITSKYASILGATNTPTTIAVTITGYAYTSTQLNCVTVTGAAVGQFIRNSQLESDYTKGTTVSAFNTTNNTITLDNGVVNNLGPYLVVSGYIPAAGTQIVTTNNSQITTNQFVQGSGVPTVNNRIKAYTPTTYVFDISNTMTESANTSFFGYVDINLDMVVASGTTLTLNNFIYSSGFGFIPYKVGSLLSSNKYDINSTGLPSPTMASRVAFSGIALNTTQFLYTTAVTPVVGEFLGHTIGARITAVDTTNKIVTCSLLTPSTPLFIRGGYISGTNTLQLSPDTDYTPIAVGQFITGGGISTSQPYSSAINSTAKTITMTGTQTISPTTDVSGIILNNGGIRYFVTKTAISGNTYFAGTNVDSISKTTGSITDTYHQYISLTAPTLQTTPYITNISVFPVSATKFVYDPSGGLLTINSFLNTGTESSKYGAYVSAVNNCELTIVNSQIPVPATNTIYGRVVKSGTTTYLYYKYFPEATGDLVYNADVSPYSNGGFVLSYVGAGGISRATINYKNQALVTNTPVAKSHQGYVSSNGTLFLNITSAERTAINDLTFGSIVEIVDGDSKNQLKVAWFSADIGPYSYNLPVLNNLNNYPSYVSSNIKAYSLVSQSRATSGKTIIFVEKASPSVADVAVNDFIEFYTLPQYNTGAVVSSISTYIDASGTYYGVTLKNRTWAQVFLGTLDIAFSSGSTVNIYRNDTFTYHNKLFPGVAMAYNMSNYTCRQEQTFSFHTPISDYKYSGTTYKSYTPITFSIYQPLTFALSAPQTITYFPTTLYSFYNGAAPTTFIQEKQITLPQTTVNDTFCLLNFTQTLTNKTLTTPTINTPTISAPSITTSLSLFGTPFNYLTWTSALSAYNVAGIGGFITGSTTNPTYQTTGGAAQYIYQVIGKQLYCKVMIVHSATTTGAAIGSGAYQLLLPNSYTISGTVAAAAVPTIDANTDIVLQGVTTTNGLTGTQIGRGYIRPSLAANWNQNIMDIYAVSSTKIIAILSAAASTSIWGSAFGFTTLASQNFTFEFSVPIV